MLEGTQVNGNGFARWSTTKCRRPLRCSVNMTNELMNFRNVLREENRQQKRIIHLFINIHQLDALNFVINLFQASTCFEHYVLIVRKSKLHYIVSSIITLKQVSGLKLLK